jgi:hypothetical protein
MWRGEIAGPGGRLKRLPLRSAYHLDPSINIVLRFAVYDERGPARDWPLTNAHLIGPDDQPVGGSIAFKRGEILCQKRGSRAVALSLLCNAGSMGRLMLQTCLLPDRPPGVEPYSLSIELARHRIKTFIAKSEEWQMFDLSEGHPAMQMWDDARALLTKAQTADDPIEADKAAQLSLERGIEASERLALAHAELLLHRRYGSRRAASSTLGVRIWPSRNGTGLRELIGRDFDVVVVPMPWRELEVEEGRYNWEPVDRWMQWAKSHNKPIVAGPLLDFSKTAVPDWLYIWQHDYDTCRDLAYDHVERVVKRYASVVGIWNLAAGVNTNENFRFSPDQMTDLVRMAGLVVRHERKGARLMVELSQPFGEHASTRPESIAPLTFIERLVQGGIRLDAIGVQLIFGHGGEGHASRDLMQISSLLDRFYYLDLPVIVSAMGVPSEAGETGATGAGAAAGWWHEGWSPQIQSSWVARVFAIAMSKPFVESVFWNELVDHRDAAVPTAGLIGADGKGKPALSRLSASRRRLRKPLGPLKLPTKADEPPIHEQ